MRWQTGIIDFIYEFHSNWIQNLGLRRLGMLNEPNRLSLAWLVARLNLFRQNISPAQSPFILVFLQIQAKPKHMGVWLDRLVNRGHSINITNIGVTQYCKYVRSSLPFWSFHQLHFQYCCIQIGNLLGKIWSRI